MSLTVHIKCVPRERQGVQLTIGWFCVPVPTKHTKWQYCTPVMGLVEKEKTFLNQFVIHRARQSQKTIQAQVYRCQHYSDMFWSVWNAIRQRTYRTCSQIKISKVYKIYRMLVYVLLNMSYVKTI